MESLYLSLKKQHLLLELQKTVAVSLSGVQRASEPSLLWFLHSRAPDVPRPSQSYHNPEGDAVRQAAGLGSLTI